MENVMMQRLCIEMNERAPVLFQSGQFSDCSFELGSEPNKDIINGHKVILAMASPVFESLLFGERAIRTFPFPIADIQPKTFRTLKEYIYTNNLTIETVEDACQLSYAAKKYMMDCLMKDCSNFLWDNLNPENVCRVYEFTLLGNAKMLQQKCLKIFSIETKKVINSKSFVNAEVDTLKKIFSMNNLNIDSELEFVVALERYMKSHGSLEASGASNENRVAVVNSQSSGEKSDDTVSQPTIRSALEKIRFLTVSSKDLIKCEAINSVLTRKERVAILKNIKLASCDIPMPTGFTTSRVPRNIMTDYGTDTAETRPEAKFRFTIHNFANLTNVVYSPPCYVQRLPWQVKAGPIETDTEHGTKKSFCFFILCNILNDHPDWSCNAVVDLDLVSTKPEIPTVSKTFSTVTFNRVENQGGFASYMEWNEVVDPETGYITSKGTVELEVQIKADPPQGLEK